MRKFSVALPARLLLMTLILLGFGLIMIYSASVAEGARDFGNKWHFVSLQLKWAGVGLVGALLLSRINSRVWDLLSPYILVVGLLLLFLVAIPGIGTKVLGARRWLVLPGITLQPAELIKLVEVIYLSSWLGKKNVTLPQFGFFLTLVAGLIMLEPDMGTTIVVVMLALALYYLNGYPLKHFLLFGVIGLAAASIFILAEPYRLERVKTFLDPTQDPQGSSYHIRQVILALGSGGISGVGIGRSRQKYEYLPEATTDSIFAVAGEELGFIGASILILSFVYFLSLIFKVSTGATSNFDRSLSAGVGSWMAIQIVLNLSSMVAFTPLTGVPLPLVSYGGSALITTLLGLGIVLSIARESKHHD